MRGRDDKGASGNGQACQTGSLTCLWPWVHRCGDKPKLFQWCAYYKYTEFTACQLYLNEVALKRI